MVVALVLTVIAAFLVTVIAVPLWIKRAKKAQLTGKDMQKLEHREVAEMGGITVLLGFVVGLLIYIALRTFYFKDVSPALNLSLMGILGTVLLVAIIGMLDDILGWKIGLRQWQKPILVALAALPIIVINAGSTKIFGWEIGAFYLIIFIPLIITIAANAFNMLAGYNGLETGQGIIILTTLGIIAWIHGSAEIGMVCAIMVACLMAFMIFNFVPAKVFPGDTLTYTVGALAGIVAIMANMELALIILYIPYAIEFFLKFRGRFKKESFAMVLHDGSLKNKYKKVYGLEHLTIKFLRKIKKKAFEKEVVITLFAFQMIFVIIALLIFI